MDAGIMKDDNHVDLARIAENFSGLKSSYASGWEYPSSGANIHVNMAALRRAFSPVVSYCYIGGSQASMRRVVPALLLRYYLFLAAFLPRSPKPTVSLDADNKNRKRDNAGRGILTLLL
ncbi:unnamed protein product [Gongylonema pulchrum]|uniref:Peptidase_M15_3 domain-containing protein n=1 Tax=Gongylonema pulchrum TaxID=637853 RepID=A0A183EAU3_9BILA|nr:unnamed protein product [Gongylonema pulchrum]